MGGDAVVSVAVETLFLVNTVAVTSLKGSLAFVLPVAFVVDCVFPFDFILPVDRGSSPIYRVFRKKKT